MTREPVEHFLSCGNRSRKQKEDERKAAKEKAKADAKTAQEEEEAEKVAKEIAARRRAEVFAQVGQFKSPPKQQSCALLTRLPLEIRQMIWRYAIGDREHFLPKASVQFDPSIKGKWLALLYTSQQVYMEAVYILYRTTLFSVVNPKGPDAASGLQHFVERVPPVYRSHIRRLRLLSGIVLLRSSGGLAYQLMPGFTVAPHDVEARKATFDAIVACPLSELKELTVTLIGPGQLRKNQDSLNELRDVMQPETFLVQTHCDPTHYDSPLVVGETKLSIQRIAFPSTSYAKWMLHGSELSD